MDVDVDVDEEHGSPAYPPADDHIPSVAAQQCPASEGVAAPYCSGAEGAAAAERVPALVSGAEDTSHPFLSAGPSASPSTRLEFPPLLTYAPFLQSQALCPHPQVFFPPFQIFLHLSHIFLHPSHISTREGTGAQAVAHGRRWREGVCVGSLVLRACLC